MVVVLMELLWLLFVVGNGLLCIMVVEILMLVG